MPRYFFDIQDGVDLRDEIGVDLTCPASARLEAMRVLALRVEIEASQLKETAVVLSVRDEAGNIIFNARLVLQIES